MAGSLPNFGQPKKPIAGLLPARLFPVVQLLFPLWKATYRLHKPNRRVTCLLLQIPFLPQRWHLGSWKINFLLKGPLGVMGTWEGGQKPV